MGREPKSNRGPQKTKSQHLRLQDSIISSIWLNVSNSSNNIISMGNAINISYIGPKSIFGVFIINEFCWQWCCR